MLSRDYLVSLPERVIRSALGLSAGLLREVGEVVLPRGVRRTQLYKSLVDTTLRFVIEQVGGAGNVYPAEEPQLDVPSKARWLTASARVGATHTGKMVWTAVLDHYSQTLNELHELGYLAYAKRQLSPYLRACVDLFSPERQTLTQRLLDRVKEK